MQFLVGLVAVLFSLCFLLFRFLGKLPHVIRAGGITNFILEEFKDCPPVFSFVLGGKTMTFVSDPELLSALANDPKRLTASFGESVLPLIKNLFQITRETVESCGEATKVASHTLLKGPEIDSMFERAVSVARPMVEQEIDPGKEHSSALFQKLAFRATVIAIYGEEAAADDLDSLMTSFLTYDQATHKLAGSVPWAFCKGVSQSFEHMKQFSSRNAKNSVTKAIRDRYDACHEKCLPDQERCLNSSFFWASLSNTIPCTCWALMHLSHNLEMQDEIYSQLPADRLTREAVNKIPLLDGVVQEVLRLYFDGFLFRIISDPNGADFVDSEGKSHHLSGTVNGYPRLYHLNEKYFQNANQFNPRRWTDTEMGQKKNKLFSFGGGVSMCAGRLFVVAEIKMFIAVFCSTFRFYSHDPMPKPGPTKGGFGIAIPESEIKISFERRQ